jgi:alkylation response protein AidB-like acyl-CoA dehydrogenase
LSPSDVTQAAAGGGADQPAEAFRRSVRQFLAERFPERPAQSGPSLLGVGYSLDDVEAGRRALALLGPGGLSVPSWPKEHGGPGLSAAENAILAEELAAREVPDLYPFAVGLNMVGPVLIHHGSSEQQHRWLGTIRDGAEIWCQLFSEPDAGSDLASLTTRAVRDGDEWRVTGQKVWSSRAQYSNWGFLLARTDPSVPKHAGITAFALDMRAAGVTVRPLRQMNRDEHFSEVFLDDARIPDADRIGAVGDGWKVAITTLMHERAAVARSAGITVHHVVDLLRSHRGTVTPVQRDRAMQAIISIEVQRMSRLRAQARAVRGEAPGPEGSGAKLLWGRTVKELTSLALELQGPGGTLAGADWLPLFLTAPSLSIRGGTDQIQQNILGERVLGLPKEPAPAAPPVAASQTARRAGAGGQTGDV